MSESALVYARPQIIRKYAINNDMHIPLHYTCVSISVVDYGVVSI